jgi:hypothetical protein
VGQKEDIYVCDHVKTMKQYRKSNIIIETRGRKTSFKISGDESCYHQG